MPEYDPISKFAASLIPVGKGGYHTVGLHYDNKCRVTCYMVADGEESVGAWEDPMP